MACLGGAAYIEIVRGRIQVQQTSIAQTEQEVTIQIAQVAAAVDRVVDYRVGSRLKLRNVVQVQTGQIVDRQCVVVVAG